MKLLLENIKLLVQTEKKTVPFRAGKEMSNINSISDAFVIIRDEIIEDFGSMEQLKDAYMDDDLLIEIDCRNRLVYPCYCDSHTHLVFPETREPDFVEGIKNQAYKQTDKYREGIIKSAKLIHQIPEEELYNRAFSRIFDLIKTGTGALEIKSGYGLNIEEELKILKVIRWLKETTPLCIRSTFLGAHTVPDEFKNNKTRYVDSVINEMIPQIAAGELADFIDVFCDRGFFSVEDTERILMAGIKYGLKPKIHANGFGFTGGVQAGVKYNALSVDQLEYMGIEEINALKNSETMPTVLPGTSFFMNRKYAPVREMIDKGLPVALASDYNPDSSPGGNMNFIASLGCIKCNMFPEEVINATTLNSAYAMGISDRLGSIARGKIANLFITSEIHGIESIPYMIGSNLIETVILNGEVQNF